MIVSCPNCSTRYALDAGMIKPPGRHVRCANCLTTWFQEPALELPREVMLDDEPETPVADKSRMLPAPSRSTGGSPAQRDIPREILRDQQPRERDFPRDSIREPQRDPLREPAREPVREAARDFGYADPIRDNSRGGETYRGHEEPALFQERDPIREIERDIARDIGRDLDRGTGVVREIGRDQMRGMAREAERTAGHDDYHEDRSFRDREASRDIGRNPARDPIDRVDRGRGDRGIDRTKRHDPSRETGKRSGGSAWVAAISVLGLVAGLGWAGDTYREQIVSAFPQMSIVYDQLGRKVNAVGLDFQALSSSLEMAETGQVLVVRGQIVNITDREIAIPDVKVIVLDASKRDIHNWTFKPEARRLTPRGRTAFTTRLDSPPAEAADLELRFAKSGG